MLDGINLFFGALIGANLGSLDNLDIAGYALLIVALAGAVMALRMYPSIERRWHAYLLLVSYALLVAQFLFLSDLTASVPLDDRQRLAITILIWAVAVVGGELVPTREGWRTSAPGLSPAQASGSTVNSEDGP